MDTIATSPDSNTATGHMLVTSVAPVAPSGMDNGAPFTYTVTPVTGTRQYSGPGPEVDAEMAEYCTCAGERE